MSKETYYNLAAKWWADEARKVNKEYGMNLSEADFNLFEVTLADALKEGLEFHIKESKKYEEHMIEEMRKIGRTYSVDANAFYNITCSRDNSRIRDILKKIGIQRIYPALPDVVMIISTNLVFLRRACDYEFMRSDRPLACDSDHVIFSEIPKTKEKGL